MMHHQKRFALPAAALALVAAVLVLACASTGTLAQTPQARTPSETVREFYKALREKRFREALMISVYKPAIEGLSTADLEELRPDFEKLAVDAEKTEVKGEQLSGETATVFVRMTDDAASSPPAPVPLLRVNGQWIVGDQETFDQVKQSGKDFFFNTRIEVHEKDVMEVIKRIQLAELAYSAQHNQTFADLPTLIAAMPGLKDLEGTESTGYRFSIKLGKDKKSYSVSAVPARYNRTGRLSFHMDQAGTVRSANVGGKPLIVASDKQ